MPHRSRLLPRPLCIMDEGKEFLRLTTLADVRDFLKRVPKGRRQFEQWQTVAKRLDAAAAGGGIDDLFIALQMAFQLERIEYR
jgi:hypothetical protein